MIAATGAFWAVLAAAAWAGLLGGFTHCAGMCGPFVLAQTARRMAGGNLGLGEMRRLRGAALLPYHLGRSTIYIGLGAVGGWLSSAIDQTVFFRFAVAVLLTIAGLMMIGPAIASLGGASFAGISSGKPALAGNRFYARLFEPLVGTLSRGSGYGLGLALGFLPCGLVYAALAAAAATGSAWSGAAIMAGFAAATVPGLVAVAFLGELAGRRWRQGMARAAPWLMAVNGAVLLWLAVRPFF